MRIPDLEGKVAIITGAAGGIGREIACLFDKVGINLVLTDIKVNSLHEMSETFTNKPLIIPCDITKRDQVQHLISHTLSHYHIIDILINTVGVIFPALFEDAEYEDIEKQIRINLLGTINCTKEIIPVMKKASKGNIVTISSLAGIVPETYSSIYTATKFALRGLNLTLNLELNKFNIDLSTIFPDSVDTPMLHYEAEHGGSPLTFLNVPIKPEKVAKTVLRAILRHKPEISIPSITGLVSKFIMCFPKGVIKIWPKLEKKGERKKQKFLNQMQSPQSGTQ
ncbi:MAG: SDR family oxidoreductase [Candidatus Lokiarchaeota archaeon]|nr:SDR family oxidoreductase [Candidatus Lokiarchaeota archaeon]